MVSIAAIFNAVMDAIENENISESVFSRYNRKFWYKRISWKYTKKIFGYRPDGWHLAKSMMIISLAVAIVLYKPIVNHLVDVVLIGIVWNSVFVLFYHKIFKVNG